MTSGSNKIIVIILGILFITGGYIWLTSYSRTDIGEHADALDNDVSGANYDEEVEESLDAYPSTNGPDSTLSIVEEARIYEARAKEARAKLTSVSSEDVVDALLKATASGNDTQYVAATNELVARGRNGDATVVQAIRSVVEKQPLANQEYLTYLLSRVASEEAVHALYDISDTSDGDSDLREASLEAISVIKDRGAIRYLKPHLLGDVERTSEATQESGNAIAAMGGPEATVALLEWALRARGEKQILQAHSWLSKAIIKDPESLVFLRNLNQNFTCRDRDMCAMLSKLVLQGD